MTLLRINTDPAAFGTPTVFAGTPPPGWRWTPDALGAADYVVEAPDAVRAQIAASLDAVHRNGLDLDTVEMEDLRLPGLAEVVPRLHDRLDGGPGFAILRGLALDTLPEDDAAIAAWGAANYVGRPIRQGLKKDRRIFTVTNYKSGNDDPIRIGATSALSPPHTDNGCLEPRSPDYIVLACYRQARQGGDSTLISAYALHAAFAARRPDLLPLLYQPYHFLPPKLHTWPAGPATIVKPIFAAEGDTLYVHYARVMIEPGMELAGTPLTAAQREALDLLDELLVDPAIVFTCRMEAGDILFSNNRSMVHGRLAFEDDPERPRCLKRLWLWQRHRGAGGDPVSLDRREMVA